MSGSNDSNGESSERPSPYPVVPVAIELDAERKKLVIGGVKTVLARLQERGLAAKGHEYGAVIGSPGLLGEFLDAFQANRDVAADLAVDKAGKPVRDNDAMMVCRVTLAQICQMLVFTCAKRIFGEADGKPKVAAAAQETKGGLFSRKPAPAAPTAMTDGERKLSELKAYIAFDWQVPLLKLYYFYFERGQLAELNRDILMLRTPDALSVAASFDVIHLRKARKTAGADFPYMLEANPQAIGGLAYWDAARHAQFKPIMGERVWDFYARDADFFEIIEEMDRERMGIIGPLLADISADTIKALDRMQIDRLPLLIAAFKAVFDKDVPEMFADGAFGRQMLLPIVQSFHGADLEPADCGEVMLLKCNAIKGTVAQWLEKRRSMRGAA